MSVQLWIASHISSFERRNAFQIMLKSCDNQTVKPHVVISISHIKQINIDDIIEKYPHFVWYVHDKQKKQFEHYLYIYDKMTNSTNDYPEFVMFGDDDDFVHPERTNFGIEQLSDDQYDASAINIIHDYSNKYFDSIDNGITPSIITQKIDIEKIEYVCLMVRWKILCDIFEPVIECDELFSLININHPHCDWQFKNAILTKMRLNITYSKNVMYFYRKNKEIKKDYCKTYYTNGKCT